MSTNSYVLVVFYRVRYVDESGRGVGWDTRGQEIFLVAGGASKNDVAQGAIYEAALIEENAGLQVGVHHFVLIFN
jgi:hypothetical protein